MERFQTLNPVGSSKKPVFSLQHLVNNMSDRTIFAFCSQNSLAFSRYSEYFLKMTYFFRSIWWSVNQKCFSGKDDTNLFVSGGKYKYKKWLLVLLLKRKIILYGLIFSRES
ncbi:hypothetical protein CEXT_582151 [Caerostris extrusa]|uniref:Uncharacterized protein n=1 Tax=Caerostris extrusa TaxID=172846 RepID=A0AAV4MCP3_CAEEX|nr:hypothetical protein CEXT_582151 [Caerostris extrusa]